MKRTKRSACSTSSVRAVHAPTTTRKTKAVTHILHDIVEYLQLIHTRRLMIRFDDLEEEHEHEIDKITAEVMTLFQTADRSLKKITRPFVGGVPCASATDELVRVNTQRSVASRLQEISYTFRKRQHEYLQRLQVQKFGCDIFDADELEYGIGSDEIDDVGCESSRPPTTVALLDGADLSLRCVCLGA